MPTIYEKLNKANIPNELWLFQWFITLFLYNFPLEIGRTIWGFMLSKKEMAPVLVALGIIKNFKNTIMEMEIIDEMDFL